MASVFVLAIDFGCYDGWKEPAAVCESRAAALAYIGSHVDEGYGGKWRIIELPVLTLDEIANPKPEAA